MNTDIINDDILHIDIIKEERYSLEIEDSPVKNKDDKAAPDPIIFEKKIDMSLRRNPSFGDNLDLS